MENDNKKLNNSEKERKYAAPIIIYPGPPVKGKVLRDLATGEVIPEDLWSSNTATFYFDKEFTKPVKTSVLDEYFDGLWVFGQTKGGLFIVKQLGEDKENLFQESLLDFNKALDDAYETTGLQKPEQQDATRIETPNYDLNFNGALNNTGEDNLKLLPKSNSNMYVANWYAPAHQYNRFNYAQNFELNNPQLDAARQGEIMRWEADKHVRENYGAKAWGKVGLLTAAEVPAAMGLAWASPYLMKGLNMANTLLTPSTYTTMLGLPLEVGTIANLATAAYFAGNAAYDIYENPKNAMNYVNFALSGIPATRAGIKLKPAGTAVGNVIKTKFPKFGNYYNNNVEYHDLLADGTFKFSPMFNMHAGRNIKNYVNELEQLVEQGNEAASVLNYLDKTTPAEFVPYMDEAANDAKRILNRFEYLRDHAYYVQRNREQHMFTKLLEKQILDENPNITSLELNDILHSPEYKEKVKQHMDAYDMLHLNPTDVRHLVEWFNSGIPASWQTPITESDVLKNATSSGMLPRSALLRTNHPNFNVADPANPLTHGRTSSDPFIYDLGTKYNVHMPLFGHLDENGQVKWLDLNLDSPSNLKIVLNPNYTRSYEAAPFDAIIPQLYSNAILENIDYVTNLFPAYHRAHITPFGSSVSVQNGNLIHATDDVDFITTERAMNSAFKDLWPTKTRYSKYYDKSGQTLVDTYVYEHPNVDAFEKSREVDLNVIYNARVTDNVGNVVLDPNRSAPTNRALELYLQFFPEEYYAAVKEAMKKASSPDDYIHLILINKSPEELVAAASKFRQEKTIMDNLNADVDIVGDMSDRKVKHLTRTYAYLTQADPKLMERALHMNARSYLGDAYRPAPVTLDQFLKGYAENVEILRKLGCPLELIPQIAKDPLKTKNYFEYWWLLNTLASRGAPGAFNIYLDPTDRLTAELGARKFSNYGEAFDHIIRVWTGGVGNTFSGTGLNAVTFGNSKHLGTAYATIQPNLNLTKGLSPLNLIKEVRYKLGMDDFELTPKMKLYIKDHFSHLFERGPQYSNINSIDDIKTFKDFVNSSFTQNIHTAKAMEEFSDEFGIIAHTLSNNNMLGRVPLHFLGGAYGSSVFRGFLRSMNREGDLVKINAYKLDASAPGSDAARQVTLNTLNDNDWFPKVTPPKKHVTLVEMPKYNGNLEQSAINVSVNKQKKHFMRHTDNDYKTLIRDLKRYGYYAPKSSNLDMHNIKLNDNGLSILPRKNIRLDLIDELVSKYTPIRDQIALRISDRVYQLALAAKKHKEVGPAPALIPTFISGVLGTTISASNHREQEYTKAANETLSLEEFLEAFLVLDEMQESMAKDDSSENEVKLWRKFWKFAKLKGYSDEVRLGIEYIYFDRNNK